MPISNNNFNQAPLSSKSGIQGTLFEKLGGDDGVNIFVNRVFEKVMVDPQLMPFFSGPGFFFDHLKAKFTTYIIYMTGGADEYHGRSIEEVHK